jgi:hypothetical protein
MTEGSCSVACGRQLPWPRTRAERIWRGWLETVERAITTRKTELEELEARASNIRALIKQDLTTGAVVVILGPEAEAEATEGVIFAGT